MEVGTEENIIDAGEYDDCEEEAHNSQSNNDEADVTIADEGEHQDCNREAQKSQWNDEVAKNIKVSPGVIMTHLTISTVIFMFYDLPK